MNDETITTILGSWETAAVQAGKNLPHDDAVRALRVLPDFDIWTIGEDGQATFGLLRDEIVFTVGFRDGRGGDCQEPASRADASCQPLLGRASAD